MTARLNRQDGSAPIVEVALGAPMIVLVIWLVIWAATAGQTPGEVSMAANDAARLAATHRSADSRAAPAAALVDDRLAGGACSSWSTTVTSTATVVTVTIACRLATPQMAGLQLGSRTVTATGRSTIDRFFLQQP